MFFIKMKLTIRPSVHLLLWSILLPLSLFNILLMYGFWVYVDSLIEKHSKSELDQQNIEVQSP